MPHHCHVMDDQRSARSSTWSARNRRVAGACGILGPIFLIVYFGAPAVTGWPYGGASPEKLIEYVTSHSSLFYAGAWFQTTGTLLSIIFYLAVLDAAELRAGFWGHVLLVASASLLSVVLVEAALLVAVPLAAQNGDKATVATSFALSNGVFARVFPLAPASGSYIALGAVVLGSGILPRRFGQIALALGVAFELAGVLAVVSAVGLYAAIGLSVVQVVWILWAAIVFGFTTPAVAAVRGLHTT
jgi:hypothetical protein